MCLRYAGTHQNTVWNDMERASREEAARTGWALKCPHKAYAVCGYVVRVVKWLQPLDSSKSWRVRKRWVSACLCIIIHQSWCMRTVPLYRRAQRLSTCRYRKSWVSSILCMHMNVCMHMLFCCAYAGIFVFCCVCRCSCVHADECVCFKRQIITRKQVWVRLYGFLCHCTHLYIYIYIYIYICLGLKEHEHGNTCTCTSCIVSQTCSYTKRHAYAGMCACVYTCSETQT